VETHLPYSPFRFAESTCTSKMCIRCVPRRGQDVHKMFTPCAITSASLARPLWGTHLRCAALWGTHLRCAAPSASRKGTHLRCAAPSASLAHQRCATQRGWNTSTMCSPFRFASTCTSLMCIRCATQRGWNTSTMCSPFRFASTCTSLMCI
jgi:hypothetical protein